MSRLLIVVFASLAVVVGAISLGPLPGNPAPTEAAGIHVQVDSQDQNIDPLLITCAFNHSYFGHANGGGFHQHWTVIHGGGTKVAVYSGSTGAMVPGSCKWYVYP